MKKRISRTFPWAQPLVFSALFLNLITILLGVNALADQGIPSWWADAVRSNKGPITFQLTPKGVEDGYFRVEILVDTHSGDLSDLDLKKQLFLKVEGREYSPLTEVRMSGHHSGGTLVFPLKEIPERFEIVIKKLRTMGDMTFIWP